MKYLKYFILAMFLLTAPVLSAQARPQECVLYILNTTNYTVNVAYEIKELDIVYYLGPVAANRHTEIYGTCNPFVIHVRIVSEDPEIGQQDFMVTFSHDQQGVYGDHEFAIIRRPVLPNTGNHINRLGERRTYPPDVSGTKF